MKKLVMAVSAIAAFSAPALAADMAAKAPLTATPIAYAPSWTGCYVGGGGGYGLWNQADTFFNDTPPRTQLTTQPATIGGRGWFATVQGGCDYQFAAAGANFVVGAYADYDFSNLHADVNPAGVGIIGTEKMSSAWSVGGRAGWLITPGLLTYFSAGYTEATFDRADFALNLAFAPAPPIFFMDKHTIRGWYLGAGDEYALNFAPGLFWKTEYRISEFNTGTNPLRIIQGGQLAGSSVDSKVWVQTVRSELVYRFNWSAPLVAKY
jgi:outer membrane immunogenic protein